MSPTIYQFTIHSNKSYSKVCALDSVAKLKHQYQLQTLKISEIYISIQ